MCKNDCGVIDIAESSSSEYFYSFLMKKVFGNSRPCFVMIHTQFLQLILKKCFHIEFPPFTFNPPPSNINPPSSALRPPPSPSTLIPHPSPLSQMLIRSNYVWKVLPGVPIAICAIAQKIAITPTSANLFVYTSDSGLLKKNKMLLHLALLSLQFNMCFSRKEFLRFAVKRRRENAVENGGKACLSGCFNQDQFHSGFPCFVPTHVSLLIQFIINYVYVIHS